MKIPVDTRRRYTYFFFFIFISKSPLLIDMIQVGSTPCSTDIISYMWQGQRDGHGGAVVRAHMDIWQCGGGFRRRVRVMGVCWYTYIHTLERTN